MSVVLVCAVWVLVPAMAGAQVCGSPPTAACISQIGSALWSDLAAWGTAAIGLAVVAAGVRWVMALVR